MHAPARLTASDAALALSKVRRRVVAHARAACVSAPHSSCVSSCRAAVTPRVAHVRSARTATRVAPLPPATSGGARRRRGLPPPFAASALDAALPYDAVFGNAAAVVAETRAVSGGDLLLLRSRTARAADSVAGGGGDDAEAGEELQLYAMDESVAEAAASMGVDAAIGAAALLECQWATVLAQHASAMAPAAARPLASVAGIAVAVGELAAAETARLRAADAAFRSGLEAQLAALGAPTGLAATSAAAGGAAWLSRLESALDLAECVEQDAVTWPGAAMVLLPGAAAEDAALLNALNALLPRAAAAAAEAEGGGGETTVAPDAAGALALAPWLEGACDRGLAAAARALGAEAHRRVAANEWRMAVRFATAEEGSAPRAPLLLLLLPVDAGGEVAPEHAGIAARVAETRAKSKLPPPLLAAWGEPAAQAQGGDALRARRDKLVRAAADAVADALAKAT